MKANILGPFGSGTNLISKILQGVFEIDMEKGGSTVIWKHMVEYQSLENSVINNQDVIFIVAYRPLESWIRSMKIEPYHIMWNRKNVNTPFIFRGDVNNPRMEFKSLIGLYETYYFNYIRLMSKYKNIVFLNYDDVIQRDRCVEYFSSKFRHLGVTINENNINYNTYNKPSKIGHGHSVRNFQEALTRLEDHRKNAEYS